MGFDRIYSRSVPFNFSDTGVIFKHISRLKPKGPGI